jgi:hypothetical protein
MMLRKRERVRPWAAALVLVMVPTATTASPGGAPPGGTARGTDDATALAPPPAGATRWGRHGHEISGRAAATDLPADMPSFFRAARDQLAYLNYEPDRWRDQRYRAMQNGFAFDHYLDLELLPDGALDAQDRFEYLAALHAAGIENAAQAAGLLPFRIQELYERLLTQFRLWRRAENRTTRAWIEQRVINDAGILGHYVADGANPHHATVHYNGWAAGWPNPQGFPSDRTFHARFESVFVGARVTQADLTPYIRPPRLLDDVRAEVRAFLEASNAQVVRLYELDRERAFDADNTSPVHRAFAVERLAAGVDMLRALWWTAWVRSAAG